MRVLAWLLAIMATMLSASVVLADTTQEVVNKAPNGLALTPPMGWNSWNKFACNVNEETVRDTADAMAASGMRDAGYQYVVIDDCWHGPRDANGFITADAQRFPSGIKALADYVHSRGLKFGIYSDAGRLTCGGRPGGQGHEYQDALTYARWGVDYLKYDWCSTGDRNAQEAYAVMADALRASGRDIVFSMCEWGTAKPWLWAKNTGNLWRTTGDIWDSFSKNDKEHSWAHPVTDIVDLNEPLWPFAGPGSLERCRHARGRQRRHDSSRVSLAFLAVGDDGFAADGRQRRRAHGRDHALDPAQQGSDRNRPGQAGRSGPPSDEGRQQRSLGEAACRRGQGASPVQPRRCASVDPRDAPSSSAGHRRRMQRSATCGRTRTCRAGPASIAATVEPHGVAMYRIEP